MLRVPTATYRLQFNAGFTFEDARRIALYLAELGVSDLYASPILKARKGSAHGYDVVDAAQINPELGGEEGFTALHQELQSRELGLLLDIVPNHMAASHENSWWMSVLENGPQSRFLHYFDIAWRDNKVLLPILGQPYGDALVAGEIAIAFDVDGFFFRYYDKRLPLAPRTYSKVLRHCLEALPMEGVGIELRDLIQGDDTAVNSRFLKETIWRIYEQSEELRKSLDAVITRLNGEPGNADTFNDLDALLDAQNYRLAYWRIASEKINYRRFFDVTDLVGVRVENPEVFEARNRRILDLIVEGKVTGLRIDHIDGLYDPIGYATRLQLRLASPGNSHSQSVYVVVEKILAANEKLPSELQVAGTTGYDFLDTLNALFIDPRGLERLTDFYRSFTGIDESFETMCYTRKKQVINELFSGEMRTLGKELGQLSLQDRNARDFAPVELLNALTEITACLSVYRTYIRTTEPSETDRERIRRAVREARRRASTAVDERLFTFLELVLLVDPPHYLDSQREEWLAFVMRWQQFTGRVMAKGVEDTAFYNYNRLISLNEVGGEPGRTGQFDPVEDFHRRNDRMQREWPDTLNATSTHDTKRSEDVRARINVLSEVPDSWSRDVRRWAAANAPLKRDSIPDANEELLLYQTLIGMWPLEQEDRRSVDDRIRQYLEKAAREAKTHTSWITPNPEYEKALQDFATAILDNEEFCAPFVRTQRRIAFHGFLNALSQVVLKVTAPGVPDFYQGTEMWDLSLVDPDNRRPVDYDRRQYVLRKLAHADVATLLRRWADGRIKLFVTWRSLDVRRRHAETLRRGEYKALRSDSPNVCAFARGDDIVVAVPRLTTQICKPGTPPIGDAWGKATIPLSGRWTNAFTGDVVESGNLAEIFARFPVFIGERALDGA